MFHVTHVVNANAIYELPFGQGKQWLNQGGVMDAIFGGWQLGRSSPGRAAPRCQIYSGRATFNRAGRSNCADPIGCNTAVSTMSADEIKKLIGVYKQPNGNIYWIDPKYHRHVTGRAVGADNSGEHGGVRRTRSSSTRPREMSATSRS